MGIYLTENYHFNPKYLDSLQFNYILMCLNLLGVRQTVYVDLDQAASQNI